MTLPTWLQEKRKSVRQEYSEDTFGGSDSGDDYLDWMDKGFDACAAALLPDIEALRSSLALALSFAPKGPVPPGLGPMFYHTLNYQDEVKLQERIDNAVNCSSNTTHASAARGVSGRREWGAMSKDQSKKELLSYQQKKCLICDKVHRTSLIISLREKDLILCQTCAKELKEALP